MRYVSDAATTRDLERAKRVLAGQALPPGACGFALEPDIDQDGDPVIWVWLDYEDTGPLSASQIEAANASVTKLTHDLLDVLEDFRPHFRSRALAPRQS